MNVQNLLGHYLGEGLGHRFSFKPAPNCLVGLRGFVMFALKASTLFAFVLLLSLGSFFFLSFVRLCLRLCYFALVMRSVVIFLLSLNKVSLK